MIDKDEFCHKIRDICPDLGECEIDVDVAFDEANQWWVVDLKKGSRRMKTFLEEGDAKSCLQGRKCFRLGIEIGQLRTPSITCTETFKAIDVRMNGHKTFDGANQPTCESHQPDLLGNRPTAFAVLAVKSGPDSGTSSGNAGKSG